MASISLTIAPDVTSSGRSTRTREWSVSGPTMPSGRIPTPAEAQEFLADRAPDKRAMAVRRLMTSPEYPLQLGRVLDEFIQGKYAGDPEFLDYLRAAAAARKSWRQIFQEVMTGPWDAPERRRAPGPMETSSLWKLPASAGGHTARPVITATNPSASALFTIPSPERR